MTATFKQPDQTVDTAPEYKAAIDASINVMSKVADNFSPHEASPLSMGITINSGKLWNGTNYTNYTGEDTALITAPVSLSRIDRFAINTQTGLLELIAGSESASPVAPSYEQYHYPICQILLTISHTTIVNADITDERPLINTMAIMTHNLSATVNPATTDDSGEGYLVGSIWINTTTDEAFRCVDATVNSAVWVNTTMDAADVAAIYAPLVSPALTGVPTAPTAAVDTNTTQLATCAFVLGNPPAIPDNSIGQLQIGSSAVGQDELKSTYQSISTTSLNSSIGAVSFTATGGGYCMGHTFYESVARDGYHELTRHSTNVATAAVANLTFNYQNISSVSTTGYVRLYYVQASKPYDLGDGLVGQFIFAIIDNATGAVESVSSSVDAPWHYNGPTDIRGKLAANGKKYRQRKDLSSFQFTYEEAMLDQAKLIEYSNAFSAAPTIIEEITQDIKQADMNLIPHPFLSNNLTGKTVVMLDPVSDLNHELSEMCNAHDEFDLNGLLHDGHITIGDTDIGRAGPSGILVPDFKWKNTL